MLTDASSNLLPTCLRVVSILAQLILRVVSKVIIGMIIGTLMWALIPLLFGWSGTVITGKSMEPALTKGDIVVHKPVSRSSLKPGAVLVVERPGMPGTLLTHRLSKINDDGSLEIKGDANRVADSDSISIDDIRGRAILKIPKAGLLKTWWLDGNWVNTIGILTVLAVLLFFSRPPRSSRPIQLSNDTGSSHLLDVDLLDIHNSVDPTNSAELSPLAKSPATSHSKSLSNKSIQTKTSPRHAGNSSSVGSQSQEAELDEIHLTIGRHSAIQG